MDTLDFIRAESVACLVKESDNYQFKKYKKLFQEQIIAAAKREQVDTTLIIDMNSTSHLRDMLTKTISCAGFECTDWYFVEGDTSCWYEMTVSWSKQLEED